MPTETFTYDPVGNRLTAEAQTPPEARDTEYQYDFDNRLTRITYQGMESRYKYDPFGRRTEKNVNGVITRYLYDGPNIITEYDGGGNVKTRYSHTLTIDDPLTITQGANNFFYHQDGLGSVMNLTDATGNISKGYTYRSFGEIHQETGNLTQPFTFTGREYDAENGLYYYRARYYDPKAGRFLTKDPIGFAGGDVNLYRYVQNNPVNWVDPLGLYDEEVHYYLTYRLSLRAGFTDNEALIIALANQGMDERFTNPWNVLLGATPLHFMPREYARRGLEQALCKKNLKYFGQFLHVLQDSYSHEGYKWYTGGHILDRHAPDRYSPDDPRDQAMYEETLKYLRMFEDRYRIKIRTQR